MADDRTDCEWLYVYGLVPPVDGRNLELLLPADDAYRMGLALAEFGRWADPAGEEQLVVLVDNAGWHVARRPQVPADVALHRLPPCTSELQPAEPLRPPVRESVANRGFAELNQMEPVLVGRCLWLIDHPEAVHGVVRFYWAAAINGY